MTSERSREGPALPPSSTYRVQLNRDFTFRDARDIVHYLSDLGVSDLYASPYLQARPGSMHGYDISDHTRLNPELGDEGDHEALCAALRDRGMGHMLDIVPNHMGIGEPSNRWWMDVLENGRSSMYAPFFDIDWSPLNAGLTGRVLLPVLGDQFGVILERGELRLFFDEGRFRIGYFDQEYPVAPRPSSLVLRAVLRKMNDLVDPDDEAYVELESIVTALEHLPLRDRTDPESVAERRRESHVSRRRLTALQESSPVFRSALDAAIRDYNGEVGDPQSFNDLERLLDDQAYRLAYWRVAVEEINYRRFFDINDLAGIRVERGEVFQATHKLIFQLLAEGKVTSLRVDHPDGLFDPYGYLRDLQNEASRHAGVDELYVVVEKILTGNEKLPATWPVAGTVGYDFLNRLNGLFVAGENSREMSRLYQSFIGRRADFEQLVYDRKKVILRVALASELNVLAYHLNRMSEKNRRSRDFTLGALTNAIRETIACFPVYRTYIDAVAGRVGDTDVEVVEKAIQTAIRRNRASAPSIFEFLRSILLLDWPDDLEEDARAEHALFVMKFQQLTGPVMAKSVEDTSFYIYNRLTSLNEVGGEPDRFGVTPEAFHRWIEERHREWPLALNNTTTHDTKRSEDVRARINVLSEIPLEWEERAVRWSEMNADRKEDMDGEPVPSANDEYLLYQTLIGTWPLDPEELNAGYTDRIARYMEKATREAKVNTSWVNPNESFDQALATFVRRVLDFGEGKEGGDPFLADFADFQEEIARDGMVNSLAQTLLKLTCPGVPDLYQGEEIWDFSLVDPDNRRPVDYDLRRKMLGWLGERLSHQDRRELATEVLEGWRDGRIKLFVSHLALSLRNSLRGVFADGDYRPVEVEGARAEHLVAFTRSAGAASILVAVPRLPRTLRRAAGRDVWDAGAWGDTILRLPSWMAGRRFRDVFTDAEIEVRKTGTLDARKVVDGFPVALLQLVPPG